MIKIEDIKASNKHVYHEAVAKYKEVIISPVVVSMDTSEFVYVLLAYVDGVKRKVGTLKKIPQDLT